jgi:hypothetical protein
VCFFYIRTCVKKWLFRSFWAVCVRGLFNVFGN